MAWTERYVTDAGAGAADGTSLANAWSWATMLTSLSSGQRANVQGAITRTTSADTFTNAGTAAAPISIRGINSTLGDLEANGRTRGGALVTTNFPVVTYTTGNLTLPSFMIAEHISVTSAIAGTTLVIGTTGVARRCVAANTHASSASAVGLAVGQEALAIDCDISCASSSTSAKAVNLSAARAAIAFCLMTGNTAGSGGLLFSATGQSVIGCSLRDANYGVSSGLAGATILGCSFRNITNAYVTNSSNMRLIMNCVAWGTAGTSKWYSSSAVSQNNQFSNFVGNMGAADTNEGDWPNVGEVALTADPFTSSTDLTLNSAAGGGAAVKAAAYPAYLDGGAWQTQAAGGGLLLPRGFTGGFSA